MGSKCACLTHSSENRRFNVENGKKVTEINRTKVNFDLHGQFVQNTVILLHASNKYNHAWQLCIKGAQVVLEDLRKIRNIFFFFLCQSVKMLPNPYGYHGNLCILF